MRVARAGGFTMLEVMISIAILALLSAALITFTFGLGGRRDRLTREGERGAMLARVLDRLERTASSAEEPASIGSDWLEVDGRGVWPAADRAGVPAGTVGYTGRLKFSPDRKELAWRERAETGGEVELLVGDIEAVLVDRFDDLVTTLGSRPPVRVCVWLAPVGRVVPRVEEEDAPDGALPSLEEPELPLRAADIVFVVANPTVGSVQPGGEPLEPLEPRP